MSGLTRSGLLVVVATASLASSAWAQTPRQVYDHHFTEGNKFQAAGRPAEALPHYQAAAEASGQIPGGVERVDRLFYNLGMALSAVGRKEESLKAMKDVEDWRRKNLGASDPETIRVIHFIGGEYMNLLDFAKAEPYVREELALTEARFKADSLETAEAVLAYAALCAHQGKREEQWKAAQRALNIREARLGPKSYLLRPPLQMLASQLVHRGEYTEAEALHRRIAGLDPDQSKNPSIAGFRRGDQLLHLGNFYKRTGRMAEAEAMYREMIEVYAQLAKLKIANRAWL